MVGTLSYTRLRENCINVAFYFKTNPDLMNLNTKYVETNYVFTYEPVLPIDEMFSDHFNKYKKLFIIDQSQEECATILSA